MFTLKRRIPSYSNEDNADFNRTIVFDEVKSINGLSCTTPSPKRNRTDRVLSPISQFSPKGPLNGTSKPQSRVRFVRGLSKNQKSRISIYLQLLNMFVAALVAAKDKSLLLFDIVRTKGLTENMHLVRCSGTASECHMKAIDHSVEHTRLTFVISAGCIGFHNVHSPIFIIGIVCRRLDPSVTRLGMYCRFRNSLYLSCRLLDVLRLPSPQRLFLLHSG
jgi:hypothetical protein